jgi:hypothetical protein
VSRPGAMDCLVLSAAAYWTGRTVMLGYLARHLHHAGVPRRFEQVSGPNATIQGSPLPLRALRSAGREPT